jgi:N-acetylmuramoyl-L-alanine amidase
MGQAQSDPDDEPDLRFILGELRNLDQQHWSALLAEMAQEELDDFHPGPDRGVKQGVLAVLTNAIMPAVLVEVGYLSNSDESRLLSQSQFQAQAAAALGRSVVRFFERYPPGSGSER